MGQEFFPPRPTSRPTIYAYQDSNPQYDGQLKAGYTTRTARERLDDIYNIKTLGPKPYKIARDEQVMRHDGTAFKNRCGAFDPEGQTSSSVLCSRTLVTATGSSATILRERP